MLETKIWERVNNDPKFQPTSSTLTVHEDAIIGVIRYSDMDTPPKILLSNGMEYHVEAALSEIRKAMSRTAQNKKNPS